MAVKRTRKKTNRATTAGAHRDEPKPVDSEPGARQVDVGQVAQSADANPPEAETGKPPASPTAKASMRPRAKKVASATQKKRPSRRAGKRPSRAEQDAAEPRQQEASSRRSVSTESPETASDAERPAENDEAVRADQPTRGRGNRAFQSKAVETPAPSDGAEATPAPRSTRRGRRGGGTRKKSAERQRAAKGAAPADDVREITDESIEDHEEAKSPVRGGMTMLINVSGGDECRIAVVRHGRLEELFIERASSQSHVGNIYKGRILNVEPSIQAAFIDFGLEKNGFLHISDVQPQYFPGYAGEPEDVGRKIPRRDRPPIQECFRRGQEVIVQVIKEGVGTKGPTLTTYLSIPGRFLVMMPGMGRTGVSRKIEDDADRRTMRDMLAQLTLPPGIGFILRTAGSGKTKRELQRDLNYLLRLWKTVVSRVKELRAPSELYEESDLVTRTIRDLYSPEFERVIVDDADAASKAREFLQIAMPRSKVALELYSDPEPLFHRFGIEAEIENINKRQVPLRSGGSLVIDSTEALVAIDVNSGRFRSVDDAEEMAVRLNVEAAEEIARQLRLRDLGGLIVCDFVDMRLDRNKRSVERALREALRDHKERAKTLRMSAFGLIEMTRQRRGPSIKRNIYFECQHCNGSGLVKMPESVVLDVMRNVQLAAHREHVRRVTVTVSADVAYQILNRKRAALMRLEDESGKELLIRGDAAFTSDQVEYLLEDARGHPVSFGAPRPGRSTR